MRLSPGLRPNPSGEDKLWHYHLPFIAAEIVLVSGFTIFAAPTYDRLHLGRVELTLRCVLSRKPAD